MEMRQVYKEFWPRQQPCSQNLKWFHFKLFSWGKFFLFCLFGTFQKWSFETNAVSEEFLYHAAKTIKQVSGFMFYFSPNTIWRQKSQWYDRQHSNIFGEIILLKILNKDYIKFPFSAKDRPLRGVPPFSVKKFPLTFWENFVRRGPGVPL